MALTTEQLVLQMDILASKTDSATNPNMTYKANATLNKGLNPAHFSGNYTKIVNALNKLADTDTTVITMAQTTTNMLNTLLLDVTTTENAAIWEALKGLMGKDTIIEGMTDILSGIKQKELLGITENDMGKFLCVDKNEDGILITKAVEIAGVGEAIKAKDVVYENEDRPEFSNVNDAITYLLNNPGNNTGGDGNIITSIEWEKIINKPKIPSELVLTDDKLCMKSEEEVLSEVELLTDNDIDSMIALLDI
jgi:hypothetical protein